MRALKDIEWSLDVLRVDLNDYEEDEVVRTISDMYSVEGGLTGIASRVANKKGRVRVPESYVLALLRQSLTGDSTWIRLNGTEHDLTAYPELVDLALVLEEYRGALLARVAIPHRLKGSVPTSNKG